ncbi:PH domain-containing protein [Streptomyces carpaticus]|uniref:PH domain-containing protein n=1 Tax=Streptomyces carpaticus TaxID=285558 RepID=UPI0031F7BEC3
MTSEPPKYADRVYRSGSALAAGVLLIGLAAWLGGDAMLRGEGRTPVTAAAALLLAVPLVTAFTFRPAVFAGDERLRVRNPFRTIVAPWATVESVKAAYSCEVRAGGATYQLWAIPVSLRARGKATRHNERLAAGESPRGVFGLGGRDRIGQDVDRPRTAPSDAAVGELRELAERHADAPGAQGEVSVRWSYEIIAPAAVGAVALLVLWITG